ncbi:hypothetical protein J7416_22180 [Ruegeria sp. R14_0]|nr:hypothetical protein [Ruegeria sp. R14_0]
MLIAEIHKLSPMSGEQTSALIGLAPIEHDSGAL